MATKKKQQQEPVPSSADQLQESSQQTATVAQQVSEDNAAAITDAGTEYQAAAAQALEAKQQSDSAAWNQYNEKAQQNDNFYDTIRKDMATETAEAKAEGEAQQKASYNAAKWTGLTELASSVVNLIGVGKGNAVSQQYRFMSQDWMRKADQDAREHRSRIANLRDRQRSIQMKMQDMRLTDAQRQLNAQLSQSQDLYNQTLNAAGQQYKDRVAAAQELGKGKLQAAQITQQGVAAAVSARQHDEALAEQKRAHNLAYSRSLNKTDKPTKPTGIPYDISIGGKPMKVYLAKDAYENAIARGQNEIKTDMVERAKRTLQDAGIDVPAGFSFDDLDDYADKKRIRVNGKKVDNPLFGKDLDIIGALQRGGVDKEDLATISSYVSSHKNDLDNFNMHLYNLSNYAEGFAGAAATDASAAAAAPAGVVPAAGSDKASWEDDPDFVDVPPVGAI